MIDFSPMLAGDATELEMRLLRSVEDDEPAADALEKVGHALGVSAALLAAAGAGSALAGPAAVAGNAVALGKPLTLLSLSKWLAVGIGAGLATGGVAHVASRPFAATATTVVSLAPVTPGKHAVAPTRGSRTPEVGQSEPAPERAPEPPSVAEFPLARPPAVTAAPPTPAPEPRAASANTGSASFETLESPQHAAATPTSASLGDASSLGDETKALDRVRQSLAGGRASDAIAELDGYRAKWPTGALRAEAALLRVDALLRLGNRAAAVRESNALITQAPGSRYAARAKALLGATAEP